MLNRFLFLIILAVIPPAFADSSPNFKIEHVGSGASDEIYGRGEGVVLSNGKIVYESADLLRHIKQIKSKEEFCGLVPKLEMAMRKGDVKLSLLHTQKNSTGMTLHSFIFQLFENGKATICNLNTPFRSKAISPGAPNCSEICPKITSGNEENIQLKPAGEFHSPARSSSEDAEEKNVRAVSGA